MVFYIVCTFTALSETGVFGLSGILLESLFVNNIDFVFFEVTIIRDVEEHSEVLLQSGSYFYYVITSCIFNYNLCVSGSFYYFCWHSREY